MRNKENEVLLTGFILATLILIGIVTYAYLNINLLQREINGLEFDLNQQKIVNEQLTEENWIPYKVTATGYAPLDPNAIEGVCYSGDPNITASGAKSDPNVTIAAGKELPFGTQVFIPGIGNRTVQDRGGAITDGHIDIMFATQQQALEYGRQDITIFIKEVQ